ncbi:hypothetical protein [Saliterribacillus persicus]|uniref:Flp pilus-assembly TadE/G-like protein n=1 Tax=Saliterribacillus persicus TaxID=930114 RepID=A0A368XCY7_9BACI|nr:hypothetical protein [Saliterribacillus persicus]RCW65831.1 hypothetical protein DFR57_11048 [Saliterribacillus persicus]
MRKQLDNQRGNAMFYLIWILGMVGILLLILTNISKVFVVGNQAKNATEQAAMASTAVIIEETKNAIEKFDDDPLSIPLRITRGGDKLETVINEKKNDYQAIGNSSTQAYIKALNDVLPNEIDQHILLKQTIRNHFSSVNLSYQYRSAARTIVEDNDGNGSDTIVTFSNTDWRIEVEGTATFKSVSDGEVISSFEQKVDGKGYGPVLRYMENVYQ